VSEDESEAFALPITGELDLHAFAPRDVVSVVSEYLDECRRRGILEVRLVHGRGRGVQRAEVRRLLAARTDVAAFDDAPPSSGGWGATLVRLSV
jgi:DNA-nicking Smr family endonuclease